MKHCEDAAKWPIRLIQVGGTQPEEFMSVREMFEQMAKREDETIRELREEAVKRLGSAQLR